MVDDLSARERYLSEYLLAEFVGDGVDVVQRSNERKRPNETVVVDVGVLFDVSTWTHRIKRTHAVLVDVWRTSCGCRWSAFGVVRDPKRMLEDPEWLSKKAPISLRDVDHGVTPFARNAVDEFFEIRLPRRRDRGRVRVGVELDVDHGNDVAVSELHHVGN